MRFRSRGKIYVLLILLLAASFITAVEWFILLVLYWLKFIQPGIYPIWFPQLILFAINLWLVDYVSRTDESVVEVIEEAEEEFDE